MIRPSVWLRPLLCVGEKSEASGTIRESFLLLGSCTGLNLSKLHSVVRIWSEDNHMKCCLSLFVLLFSALTPTAFSQRSKPLPYSPSSPSPAGQSYPPCACNLFRCRIRSYIASVYTENASVLQRSLNVGRRTCGGHSLESSY